MSRIGRSDTITVYNATGEVDRRAVHRATVVFGVHVEESSAAVATMTGRQSADGVWVSIPSYAPGYVDPLQFDGQSGWTLRDGDYIAIGEAPATLADAKLATNVYRIKGVEVFRMRGRVHHIEVAGA